ncbi:MAG: hypothetical protein LH616_06790 [Ilumatobacteraceae bacterium]|nr:hypothetical protein [Ilumatobacteraceae bacterium]
MTALTTDTAALPTTLVLLDPTSHDGENALGLLDATDEHITLLVLLSGHASRSLRDFARAEEIDMSTAGWRYLEQVVARVESAPEQLLAMTACGPSAAVELADVAATETVRRVLLPSSVDRLEPGLADLLARCVQAPVITAPALAHTT